MMGRLGVLKPLRGTESSLANVVLEDGEIAFAYPTTGPGTGTGGIKMGDGVKTFANLDWYVYGGDSPTPTPWEYNTGTDEAALLNNIQHPEYETIGKIYYIQAYYHNSSSQYTQGTPAIEQGMPYMVIGINNDGTTNTVDLMSLVCANYIQWNSSTNSWSYGKYSTSGLYSWLSTTCPNGYSTAIQSKMINMTERWREATGNATGEMQSRQTKCKLLNPVEMFGYSSATFDPGWQYASSSDHKTDFDTKYGRIYPVWTDSIGALTNRRIFHDKAMSTASYSWLNSWLAFRSGNSYALCFDVLPDGSCNDDYVHNARGVAPVIRLQGTSSPSPTLEHWQKWVNAGGLDYTDYDSFEDVLADESAIRRLMTIHNSVDYLVEHHAASFVSTIINNDYCAKWINLRDYALDTLYADSTIAALMDQADKYFYGEWTIVDNTTTPPTWGPKGNVPIMTSNTSPYGTASASSEMPSPARPAWYAFDNANTEWVTYDQGSAYIQYKFVAPVCAKMFSIFGGHNQAYSSGQIMTINIKGSNDGNTFTEIYNKAHLLTASTMAVSDEKISNTNYYLFYRVTLSFNISGYRVCVKSLQFYGRELKVSVPAMTSNIAPYGEVIASGYALNNSNGYPYMAFDNDNSSGSIWYATSSQYCSNVWIGYDFKSPKKIYKFIFKTTVEIDNATTYQITMTYKIQGSNDSNIWTDLTSNLSYTTKHLPYITVDIDSDQAYRYYRLFIINQNAGYSGFYSGRLGDLQFYGLDYSEYDWDTDNPRHYIYDHGVELEKITADGYNISGGYTVIAGQKELAQLYLQKTDSASKFSSLGTNNTINLASYNIMRVMIGNKATATSDGYSANLICGSSKNQNGDYVTMIKSITSDLPYTVSADISSASGNEYVSANAGYVDRSISITEWWLE